MAGLKWTTFDRPLNKRDIGKQVRLMAASLTEGVVISVGPYKGYGTCAGIKEQGSTILTYYYAAPIHGFWEFSSPSGLSILAKKEKELKNV